MCSKIVIKLRQCIIKIKSHVLSIVKVQVLHQSILGLLDVISLRRGITCDCCWRYLQTWKVFSWSRDVHHRKSSTDEEGSAPMLHSTISLTAGSVERSPLHQWKASRGGHLHLKKNTFSKSTNTFNNNRMWCLFLNWWHLTTLRRTDVTMDIMWLFILILTWFNDYFALRL